MAEQGRQSTAADRAANYFGISAVPRQSIQLDAEVLIIYRAPTTGRQCLAFYSDTPRPHGHVHGLTDDQAEALRSALLLPRTQRPGATRA